MTPTEKADWLDTMNRHLAAGGKVQFSDYPGSWVSSAIGPAYGSDPDEWRMVPLPRKNNIYVAYRWDESGVCKARVVLAGSPPQPLGVAWKIAIIEVTEGEA
jgi:hypothetical protein